jgi:hypothetical protein
MICFKCHQPITKGSRKATDTGTYSRGSYHIGFDMPYCQGIGCPEGGSIIDNLKVAMGEGFVPEFCRTHYIHHKVRKELK